MTEAEAILKKKKERRCKKETYDLVPNSLEETTQAMMVYESNTFRQMNIAESLHEISVGNDGGYINLGMTTRAASLDGNW